MRAHWLLAVAMLSSSVACKDNTVNQTENTTNNYTTVGPKGGVVEGPNGVKLEIPPGALRDEVTLGISIVESPETAYGKSTLFGDAYDFTPSGLELLVDATITIPAPAGYYQIATSVGTSPWFDFAGDGNVDERGLVRFKVSSLARFALFKPDAARDFGVENLESGAIDNDVVRFGKTAFWSHNIPSGSGTIMSAALQPQENGVKELYTNKYVHMGVAAVDADWVYFQNFEPNSVGRMHHDGSSVQETWIADASGKGVSGSMISSGGFLYAGIQRIEIATPANITEHGLGGGINAGCVSSPDGKRARCAWGDVDFVAGTATKPTEQVIPFASNATHWLTTTATTRPYPVRLEAHGTGVTTATGLLIERTLTWTGIIAANATHAYMADCSDIHWIDLASPATVHIEKDLSRASCIKWLQVDDEYLYVATGSSLFRVPLNKLRSPL